jgi:type IV pilus assembly protein PilQ
MDLILRSVAEALYVQQVSPARAIPIPHSLPAMRHAFGFAPWTTSGVTTSGVVVLLLMTGLVMTGLVPPAVAQERPSRRQTQTQVSSELLVSFQKDTTFDRFLSLINPLFKQNLGKPVVDPEGRSMPIGVSISGMHFLDAFEQVIDANQLTYRETDSAFLVQAPGAQESQSDQASAGGEKKVLATLSSREIRINAILFNVNLTEVRTQGLKWSELFPGQQGGRQGGGRQGGGGQGGGSRQGGFLIQTGSLLENVDDVLQVPDQVSVARFQRFLNLLEQDDVGRTVANPQVTVQSGQQGRIQIGQDVPIQTTDFAGNTVTQFFETGIIVDVVPTLITEPVADTAGAPRIEFIHMDVKVEDSNSQPSASGPIINRNQANTQVLLLNGEATVIGGLITTQQTESRVGIPILKDLPRWFLGLRYIFGNTTTNVQKQELLIVLRAEVVDPLRVRARESQEEGLVDKRRRQAQEALERLGERYRGEEGFPKPKQPKPEQNP